jgi:hypothetical protein
MNLRLALLIPVLAAAPTFAQQYGEKLTLGEATGISAIVADPGAFDGKLVQVKGTIVDVCPHAGCYAIIKEDGSDKQITFKVEDGAMVFKTEHKGHPITAEGTVALMAPKECEGCGGDESGDCCEGAQPAPKMTARLNGVGALVQ